MKSNDSIIDVEQGQRHDPIRIETAECSEKEKPGNEGLLVDKTPSLIHETTKLAEVSIDRIEQTMQDVRNSLIHDSEVAQPSRFEALSLIQEEEETEVSNPALNLIIDLSQYPVRRCTLGAEPDNNSETLNEN